MQQGETQAAHATRQLVAKLSVCTVHTDCIEGEESRSQVACMGKGRVGLFGSVLHRGPGLHAQLGRLQGSVAHNGLLRSLWPM